MPKVESLDDIIIGKILVCRWLVITLFDMGSTYSYVSSYYTLQLELSWEPLFMPSHVASLVGVLLVVDQVYRLCVVTVQEYNT